MLSGIFGKKADHPLADIKAAQALLEDLPKNDAHKALMELTDWIESVADYAEFKADHRFAVLNLLDEQAQPYVRKLTRDYFTLHELGRFQENRLWLVQGSFYLHTARAWVSLFDRYWAGDKGSAALKGQIALITARAINAMIAQLKYICAHYGPVDSRIWHDLARLYRLAEQHGYLDVQVSLYPGLPANASVRSAAAHLLGWYGCGVHTLAPLDIHFTERLIGQYCTEAVVTPQRDAGSLFCFDLDKPAAPQRVNVDATVSPSQRCISLAPLLPRLESLLATLDKNIVPDELNLGATYEAGRVRVAARYLLDYLGTPPKRRAARRGIRMPMSVVKGFGGVIETTDVGLNFNAISPEQWEIEDVSASGFHTVLPAPGNEGVRIGMLLGMQPGGVQQWGVAVVRRLLRDEAGRLHVGAELLTNHIAGMSLRQGGGAGGFEDGQAALWLYPKPEDMSGEVQLLMKADTFSMNRSLQTALGGKNYLLIPNTLKEHGPDYDLAVFRCVEQEQGAEEDY